MAKPVRSIMVCGECYYATEYGNDAAVETERWMNDDEGKARRAAELLSLVPMGVPFTDWTYSNARVSDDGASIIDYDGSDITERSGGSTGIEHSDDACEGCGTTAEGGEYRYRLALWA